MAVIAHCHACNQNPSKSNLEGLSRIAVSVDTIEIEQSTAFTLAYDEYHEQAKWVSYTLNRGRVKAKRLPRRRSFSMDSRIATLSATDSDYRNSGWTRGHLAPSADMSYNAEAQELAYRFSNISPQAAKFNGGIWRELEETVRDWAVRFGQIDVVTGPLFLKNIGSIGQNDVTIPSHFFKVVLDHTHPELKGIGFIIPNEVSYKALMHYAVTIDQVELATSLDLFADQAHEVLEAKIETSKWPIKRYIDIILRLIIVKE